MGDMADYTLEQLESTDLYWGNVMYIEEEGVYRGHGHKSPKKKTCKYCGNAELYWGLFYNMWLLCDNKGKIHNCPKHSLPLNVLKILAERNLKTA